MILSIWYKMLTRINVKPCHRWGVEESTVLFKRYFTLKLKQMLPPLPPNSSILAIATMYIEIYCVYIYIHIYTFIWFNKNLGSGIIREEILDENVLWLGFVWIKATNDIVHFDRTFRLGLGTLTTKLETRKPSSSFITVWLSKPTSQLQ